MAIFLPVWQKNLFNTALWRIYIANYPDAHAGKLFLDMLPQDIETEIETLLMMAPPSQELEPPANPGRFRTPMANPYTLAFKGIFIGLAACQREWGIGEPVDFIFDERPEKQQVLGVWDHYVANLSEDLRAMTGRRPSFEDDKKVLPLQAADLWAWWCRKLWRDSGGVFSRDSYPVPWGKVGDIPQLFLQWSPEQIEADVASVALELSLQE